MNSTIEVSDMGTLLEATSEVQRIFLHHPWWRGHANAVWQLIPHVHRAKVKTQSYERTVLERFEQFAWSRHHNCPPSGQLHRWMFLAQHWGVPTRLLDWSESVLIAVYFAVSDKDPDTATKDGAIWALDPYALNQSEFGQPIIYQPSHENVRSQFEVAFGGSSTKVSEKFAAIVAAEIDPKMMVQASAFTIHGTGHPMENRDPSKMYLTNNPEMILRRFSVPASAKKELRGQLKRFGIRERSIFPDLSHLASDIRSDVYLDS